VGVSIKPDHWIRRMALEHKMIEPFEPALVRAGVLSYGLSSYGYDLRLAGEFKLLSAGGVLDPKAIDPRTFVDSMPSAPCGRDASQLDVADQTKTFDLPPHTFVLGRTVEYLRIPHDVLALCTGKSSYARCGVIVNTTPFEPGWEGYVTLCIANTGPRPVRLYVGEGIAQLILIGSDEPCELTYADRASNYQAQQGVTPTRVS
jgi:dCTP deaminase